MKKRLITSAVLIVILVALFFSRLLTLFIFDAAFGVLAVLACIEVSKVLEQSGKINHPYFVATFPATLYLISLLFINKNYTFTYFILFYLIAIIVYFLVIFLSSLIAKKSTIQEMARFESKDNLAKFSLDKGMYSVAMFLYPATLFMSMIWLNHFNEFSVVIKHSITGNTLSLFVLLLTLVVTMCCDSLAMVTGMIFKGPKLCPKISPKKTISGAIGGFLGGTLSGMILYFVFTTSSSFVSDFGAIGGKWWHVLIISLIGSILCQLGDITASLFKRKAQVKDYGNVFPGHGGVMDRMDGMIFMSTWVTIFMMLLAK